MKSGIYKITSGSGKIYIGSSKDVKRRMQMHLNALKRGDHDNSKMQNSYNKNQNFKFDVLLLCSINDLIFYEQLIIDNFNPDLNLSKIAGRIEHTEEVRMKISLKQKGKKIPEEIKNKNRISALIQFSKPGSKDAIIESNKRRKGEKRTDEQKEAKSKISKLMWEKLKDSGYKRRPDSEETKIKKRNAAKLAWERKRNEKNSSC